MKPGWYKDLPHWGQEVVDQTLHFILGFSIAAVAGLGFSIGMAVLRETVQNWGDDNNDYLDMMIDLLFWTIGAVVASAVA